MIYELNDYLCTRKGNVIKDSCVQNYISVAG